MKWLLLLFLIPSVFACVVPTDGMVVRKSVELCSNVYYLDHGLSVAADDVTVTCLTTVLKTWRGGTGVLIVGRSNVTIENCRLIGYDVGFLVKESDGVMLRGNHLVNTQVGARFFNATRSATFNHDVSLLSPLDVEGSSGNSFSLKNKRVAGQFCKDNLCNVKESVAETAVAPKLSYPQRVSWLESSVTGNSVSRLRAWVLSGLI